MNASPEPVVISGAGLISALGQGVAEAWERMLRGEAVAASIPDAWLAYGDYRSRFWAPLPEIDFARYAMARSDTLRFDRVSMMAIGACHEALQDAGVAFEPRDRRAGGFRINGIDRSRIGVYIGTGIGGINTTLGTHLFHAMKNVRDDIERVVADSDGTPSDSLADIARRIVLERRFNPLAVTMLMSNAVSAAPAVRFGITGPCRTTTLACASGTVAIGDAFRAVEEGRVDLAIAGAAEYLFDDYGSIFRTYDITGALAGGDDAARVNRPFDAARSGFLFSEGGAAVVILERASTARARGVEPLAEIAGFSESFDGHDLIAMDPGGESIRHMMADVLLQAGIGADAVDYVNAHGTGTEMNDRIELEAIDAVLGNRPLVNSTKSLIGHAIGASGAIEAVVTALSIRDGRVHPCGNLDDPILPLNFPRTPTNAEINIALSQSFAFGGHNACLLLRKPRRSES